MFFFRFYSIFFFLLLLVFFACTPPPRSDRGLGKHPNTLRLRMWLCRRRCGGGWGDECFGQVSPAYEIVTPFCSARLALKHGRQIDFVCCCYVHVEDINLKRKYLLKQKTMIVIFVFFLLRNKLRTNVLNVFQKYIYCS